MTKDKTNTLKTSDEVTAFAQAVINSLLAGKKFQIPGFGTFSSCSRKATADRSACKIAMFRADKSLRNHIDNKDSLSIDNPQVEVINELVKAMQGETGVDVPLLGYMAAVPVTGKPAKIVFHASKKFNEQLSKDLKV